MAERSGETTVSLAQRCQRIASAGHQVYPKELGSSARVDLQVSRQANAPEPSGFPAG